MKTCKALLFARSGSLTQLVLAAVLTVTAAASTARAERPAGNARQGRYEVIFIRSMIDHHFGGSMMASLCPGRATHRELLSLCRSIVEDQQGEVRLMRGWLGGWYRQDKVPSLDRRMAAMIRRMRQMRGAAFEQMFLEEMPMHHRTAIRNSAVCRLAAEHGELKDLCTNMVVAQRAESRLMNSWRCKWYGDCE